MLKNCFKTSITYLVLCELINHAHILQDFPMPIKVSEEKTSLIHGKSTKLGSMRVVRFLNQTNSCFPFIKAKWHRSMPHFTRWPSRRVHNFEQAQYDWDVCITLQYVCFHVCSGDGSRKLAFSAGNLSVRLCSTGSSPGLWPSRCNVHWWGCRPGTLFCSLARVSVDFGKTC